MTSATPAASTKVTRPMSAAGRRPTAVMMLSRTSGRWLNTRIFNGCVLIFGAPPAVITGLVTTRQMLSPPARAPARGPDRASGISASHNASRDNSIAFDQLASALAEPAEHGQRRHHRVAVQ